MRYLLSVAQAGSLKGAARQLGVDKTTVSRRLRAMERSLGRAVVEVSGAELCLTEFGRSMHRHAEVMRDEMQSVNTLAEVGTDAQLGTVRLTAVPLVINRMLLPALPDLHATSQGLRLELISEARDLSLLRGEADIALRLARPTEGGQSVLTRRLGELEYAAYTAQGASADSRWVGYEPRMQYLSHAAAIEKAAKVDGACPVTVNDAETLFRLVCAGQGRTLLPRFIGDDDARLAEVPFAHGVLPKREVWLMVRKELRDLERVQVVVAWISRIFAGLSS